MGVFNWFNKLQIKVTHPTLSVTMLKPTDEYFGRYQTGFFSSAKIHFLNLNVLKNETYTLN